MFWWSSRQPGIRVLLLREVCWLTGIRVRRSTSWNFRSLNLFQVEAEKSNPSADADDNERARRKP
jgi:hypothetical protein